ncbi:hypothetical protein BOO69_12500 [Sulfitobacter alexandrii]|uniref:Asp/Glu racemase n=1 Tax=Sulfitobacter alexandrii TaxID=1917485 RepID=A0A1J0WII3_9RHOB|nr:aspartate/glutamate racemase family protein [Sulfitobacter alexandrii]APE44129.1 hypothetical protein BOO69_12500 [Sulfitobacter alexandrii]
MASIICLHTARVHVATFAALFGEAGFAGTVDHVVRPGLLARARASGAGAVRADLDRTVDDMAGADAVLCTCSTLGPLIDDLARTDPRLVRIDRPMMTRAATLGGAALVVICLDSTRAATLDLLHDIAAQKDVDLRAEPLLCAEAWPLFEAGRTDDFARALAAKVRHKVAQRQDLRSVVLAQASMMGAQDHLADIGLPVLSSPPLAVDRAIAIARS